MYRTLVLCCIKEWLWHAHYGLFVVIIILCWADKVICYYTLAFYVVTLEKTFLMSSLFVNFVLGTANWILCSRQFSILSLPYIKITYYRFQIFHRDVTRLERNLSVIFNFTVIRPVFSTHLITFAYCRVRYVLFANPRILHSLSFRYGPGNSIVI